MRAVSSFRFQVSSLTADGADFADNKLASTCFLKICGICEICG
jgi:hypothetical protein